MEHNLQSPASYVFSAGAIALLRELPAHKNVLDKVNCLLATVQMICNSVKNYEALHKSQRKNPGLEAIPDLTM
jgi:hypothetical protein